MKRNSWSVRHVYQGHTMIQKDKNNVWIVQANHVVMKIQLIASHVIILLKRTLAPLIALSIILLIVLLF